MTSSRPICSRWTTTYGWLTPAQPQRLTAFECTAHVPLRALQLSRAQPPAIGLSGTQIARRKRGDSGQTAHGARRYSAFCRSTRDRYGCPVSHPLRAPSADIRTGHRRLRFPFLLWEAMLRLKGPSVRASKTICVLLNRGRSMAPTVQIGQSEMLATANTPEFGPWIARPEVGGLGQGVSVRGGTGPRLRPEAR